MKKSTLLIYLVLGIITFVFLPLFSWGIMQAPGFFAHPARIAYAVLISVYMAVVTFRFPEANQNSGKGKKTDERQHIFPLLMQALSFLILFCAGFCEGHDFLVLGLPEGFRYAGLLLMSFGYFMMCWTVITLGRQFSVEVTVQEGHCLIGTGPYRLLRHPRYLGILLFFFGIALTFQAGLAMVLLAIKLAIILWRIRDEEAFMRAEFGPEWDEFVAARKRLIPYIY